jgi:hypothetical protein
MGSVRYRTARVITALIAICLAASVMAGHSAGIADAAPSRMTLTTNDSGLYPGERVIVTVNSTPTSGTISIQVQQGSTWRTLETRRASFSRAASFVVTLPSSGTSVRYRAVAGRTTSNILTLPIYQAASTFWMNQSNLESGRLLYSVIATDGGTMSSRITFPFRAAYSLLDARGSTVLLSQRASGDTALYTYVPGEQPQYWSTIPIVFDDASLGRTDSEVLVMDNTFVPGSGFTDIYAVNQFGQKTQTLVRFPLGNYQYTGNYPILREFTVNPTTREIYVLMTFAKDTRYFVGRLSPNAPPANTSLTALQMLQDQSWISNFGIIAVISADSVSDIQFSPSGRTFGYLQHAKPITSGGSVCTATLGTSAMVSPSCDRLNTGDFVYDMAIKTDKAAYYVYQDSRRSTLVKEVDIERGVEGAPAGSALSVAAG